MSIVLRRRSVILPSAIVVTMLLAAVDIAYQVLYDLGGAMYARFSFWISVAWTLLSLTWLVGLGLAFGSSVSHWQTTGRWALWPLAVYAAGAAIFWGLWTLPDALSTHSDAAMIRHFRRHEVEFDRLAEMFAQDSQLSALCSPGRALRPRLTAERAAEYEALLGAVDVRHGLTRERHGEALFRYWSIPATGFADQNVEKGYTSLDVPPSRLAASLDDPTSLPPGSHLSSD